MYDLRSPHRQQLSRVIIVGYTHSSIRVSLGYGRLPLMAEVPADAEVLWPPPPPPIARPLDELLAEALRSPIDASRLRGAVSPGSRVAVIVSDPTRAEPRAAILRALQDEMDVDVKLHIAVANGTHAPGDPGELGLPDELLAQAVLHNHDGSDESQLVDLGTTTRGTRVRFPAWLLDTDLVVLTGRIRPHYFAGFGAGAKALFPGLGQRDDIRVNHRLKADPTSRLGRVLGNACRDDIEEAVSLLPVRKYLINLVLDDAGTAHAAVAGDLVAAHRAGVEACRPLCEVGAGAADVVITSEGLPLSGSLYQASKLLAPAGLLLRPGGVAVLAAECPQGTGPLKIVNEGIYDLGIRHFFPQQHTIYLVSSMSPETVATTYCRYAPTVESVLARHSGRVLVMPRAGNIVPVRRD